MAKEKYEDIAFKPETLRLLHILEDIIRDYQRQGYVLSLRQLYYQMVARDHIPNNLRSYKRLGTIVKNGRMAGRLDWAGIEDRTREFICPQRWADGRAILDAVANSYHEDMWVGQDRRVFVVVEKSALVGVLGPVCRRYDVPLLAAVGYPSPGVLRNFCLDDLVSAINARQEPLVLHLGDHDPSGLDMTRDLQDRINVFAYRKIEVRRIALNLEQVQELRPPPNPAKETDSRFKEYQRIYGSRCWELDAIAPRD
ncbi:MAG: hypothetical protein ABI612_16105 [Betaproteobacteria bacterium]